MRVLALDTACDFCTLVLIENGKVIAERSLSSGREQARVLAPMAEQLLKENNLKIADIDRLAVCNGPGSFTGLRVGLAFMRGLSLAASKPLYGFDHFTCSREALKRQGKIDPANVLIIRESKREELFAYVDGEMFLATPEALLEKLNMHDHLFFTGNGATHVLEKAPGLASRLIVMAHEELVLSAALMAEAATTIPTEKPEPLYLRDADVTFPKSA